jgi:TonB family protein
MMRMLAQVGDYPIARASEIEDKVRLAELICHWLQVELRCPAMLDTTGEAPLETPSARRLVIRVKLIPQEPQPQAWWRSNKSVLLIVVAVAALLAWLGISTFRSDPEPSPPLTARTESAPVVVTPPPSKPVTEVQPQPDAPPSAINEVIPDVPQSALDTIRGTVRVSVRVVLDKRGAVIDATADDRGPSRYFERLAVEASKQWTFTPANLAERRTVLVRFNFTRAGATAHANPA